MEFSTLNESSLHKTLKTLFAEQTNGKTEVKLEGHIYDIVTENNSIIEIQTKNISALRSKIEDTLNKGFKIQIIHPVIIQKKIETYDKEGKLISSRKSPKKENLYSWLKEVTGIYDFLLNPNFSIKILEIKMIEQRLKSEEKVQSANQRRRFKKDWIKNGKKLEEIIEEYNFSNSSDYLKLLPENLPEEFSANTIKEYFEKQNHKENSKYANLILWLFSRMNLIIFTEKKQRSNFYKLKSV